MEIFISEKVLDSVDFSDNEKIEMMGTVDLGILDTSEADVNYAGAYEIFAEIPKGTIVKSLEQHDKEIRKPLEDEIERLKEELAFEDRAYNALSKVNDNNIKLAKKNEDAYFTMRDLKYQERQKIIAELEKFIKEKEHFEGLRGHWGGMTIDLTLLKQKLNEMKGEK